MTSSITASLLYSHLSCPHRVAMDAFADPALRDDISPFVQLLWERGTNHERDVITGLGQPYLDLSALAGDAKEAATRAAIERREPLIYGGRLSVDELLGEPDLLQWEENGYTAIDIKSGAWGEGASDEEEEGKPKKIYGVQIALYTDILMRLGVSAGRYGYIWDVHGEEKKYELDTPLGPRTPPLWEIYIEARRTVDQTLSKALATRPAASAVCKLCVWRSLCLKELKGCHDLTLLPELGRARRDALAAEFHTLEGLAGANVERYIDGGESSFKGVGAKMLRKFKTRAGLAVAENPVPFLTGPVVWPTADVELFFDIETDPMRDLCYLHGFVIRENRDSTTERFVGVFAEDLSPEAERDAFVAAMGVMRAYPMGTVVHYSKYERTEYRKLQRKYPDVATSEKIEALFARPRALDLYLDVVRPCSEWPTMGFGIKDVAPVCGFKWRDADPSGAASIEWFDKWAKTGDERLKQRLLEYNEDDCIAMRVVLDRMKELEVRAG